jgi:hypothetical protein
MGKKRTSLVSLGLAAILVLFAALTFTQAVEIPPPGNPTYIQTNAPATALGRGDWYTNNGNGPGAGYHYFTINIPCGWPSGTPVNIDLFSP